MLVLTRTNPTTEFVESTITLHNVLHVPDLMNNGAKDYLANGQRTR